MAGIVESQVRTVQVPGAFEIPLACLAAAEREDCDAVIALWGGDPQVPCTLNTSRGSVRAVSVRLRSKRVSPWFLAC